MQLFHCSISSPPQISGRYGGHALETLLFARRHAKVVYRKWSDEVAEQRYNKELKCPKCGSAFTVNEADYASIINQIKNSEFESEVCKRIDELKAQQ